MPITRRLLPALILAAATALFAGGSANSKDWSHVRIGVEGAFPHGT